LIRVYLRSSAVVLSSVFAVRPKICVICVICG
jgi:hypothetical protein